MRHVFWGSLVVVGIAIVAACSDDETPPASSSSSSSSSSSGSSGGSTSSGGTSSSGSSGSTSGGTSSGSVVTQDCAGLAESFCGFVSRCYPSLFALGYTDVNQCKTRFGADCSRDAMLPGRAAATALPAKCFPAANAACESAGLFGSMAFDPDCTVKGTLANNSVCELGAQCASGNCQLNGISSPDGDTCGKCADFIAENGNCSQSESKCAPGLYCDRAGGTGGATCKKLGTKDATCSGLESCKFPLRCSGGTCKDPLPLEAACAKPAGFNDDPCATSTSCINNKCTRAPAAPQAATNAACGLVDGGVVLCGPTDDCDNNKCVPRIQDNATCDPDGVRCLTHAECTNNKCGLPPIDRCK